MMLHDGAIRAGTPRHTPIPARPPDWTEQAKCLGRWDAWDSRQGGGGVSDDQAAAMCAGCPVIAECLADAMTLEAGLGKAFRDGVRGGLTPIARIKRERLDILAAEGRCPCGDHPYDPNAVRWTPNGSPECRSRRRELDRARHRRQQRQQRPETLAG